MDEKINLDMIDLPKRSTDARRHTDGGRGMHELASSRIAGMPVWCRRSSPSFITVFKQGSNQWFLKSLVVLNCSLTRMGLTTFMYSKDSFLREDRSRSQLESRRHALILHKSEPRTNSDHSAFTHGHHGREGKKQSPGSYWMTRWVPKSTGVIKRLGSLFYSSCIQTELVTATENWTKGLLTALCYRVIRSSRTNPAVY